MVGSRWSVIRARSDPWLVTEWVTLTTNPEFRLPVTTVDISLRRVRLS
jgi:hypothetical protein